MSSDPRARTLVVASGNPGKLREIGQMLAPLGWNVRPQSDWQVPDAVEDGLTFLENALIKARHAAGLCGHAALGDDSGLVVDALHGSPGIRSARFAGDDADDAANNRLLLERLSDVRTPERTAHFYCAMVLVNHPRDPAPLVATGRWDGVIVEEPKGANGFGYDPLFRVPSEGCTSAELPPDRKNVLSHRAIALRGLLTQLGAE